MKQVKLLDPVNEMLKDIVTDERDNKNNLGANKQSIVNELIIARHKKVKRQPSN